MTPEHSGSPLELIRRKERELSRRLEATRAEADEQRRRAQTEGRERLAQAHREAAAEARRLLELAIAEAEQEATTIRHKAQEASARLAAQRQARIDAVAKIVVEWVLPERISERQPATTVDSR
jgi:vacuolar-type H+-ATPase subunit H